ncbi:MAG TPA: HlyD family efflux transporter periplasmic adaptor subunit [Vicinamibacterales bacterium]|jgi:HlyD family secretion protein|nr:HlyD family efflux transporter periplasmic adaptor subunit [Vicinamibacterales bacterium]
MKRTTVFIGAAVIIIAGINFGIVSARRASPSAKAAPASDRGAIVAAGPGRVEALSEEVRVSAQVGGRLQAVLVEENDHVTAGQVLATIDNADYRARVASAEATLQLREAEARKVHNGARAQERRDADAAVREAEAVVDNATADAGRRRDLFRDAVISRAELDNAEQAFKVARAKLDSVRERLSLLDAGSREEDHASADAEIALALAALEEARAMLQKTFIRAPIDGVVLRRHRRAGETVSTQFESPVVTIADRSRTRVRVDVDEVDVARLREGQAAYVTADAFGARRFSGRVVRVGQVLGRKNVRTDEPTERVDTKVLETLIELADGHDLPLGLRVQAFILDAR